LTSSATERAPRECPARDQVHVAAFVRMVKIARPHGVRMEFDAAEIHYPGQAGGIVDNHLFRGTPEGNDKTAVLGPDGGSFGAGF
jgi:hypothetical protein